MRFICGCIPIWLCASIVQATAYSQGNRTDFDPGPVEFISARGLANNIQLRIMCLGASIVYGYESTDGNGFRYALRNALVYNGNPVNMVGSVKAGSMADNDVEGWGGYVISQMQAKAALTVPQQPNIVLVHVGTNDMLQNIDYTNAHIRLGGLIDYLFNSIPGVTIIASTLLPLADGASEARKEYYNSQIPGMVQARQQAGKKITYVDFSTSWFSTADLNADGIHPTNAGYQKMAAVWYEGLQVAANAGLITPPATVAGYTDVVTASNNCDKIPGNVLGPYQIQFGSGVDDGPYVHNGTSVGGFNGFKNPASVGFDNPLPEGVFWADINGDGVDDYVYVPINSNGGLGVALNLGNGDLGEYLWYPFSVSCARPGVRFADMTGDGRDDFCCVQPNGDLFVWENRPGSDPRSPVWVAEGVVKAGTGYPRAQVHLADIDGDGRADYVGLSNDGTTMWGWRNGAQSNGQVAYWTPFGGVAFNLPVLSVSGWRFADLNGDHRDDLVHVDVNGQVTTWINQRGFTGGAMTPVWQSMGVTHGGASSPRNVTFGAFMGTGRADYSTVTPASPWSEQSVVYVDRYMNNDHGGVRTKADGDRYCDMTGDGFDDYIWLSITGDVTVYGNQHTPGTWIQWGQIYSTGTARRNVRFADFDGDKKCDILIVDPVSGATTVLQNNFANGKFSFKNLGVVTGSATCTEGYGYMDHDIGVHWNDISGDGRADFLCMQSNGVITGYLNEGIGKMVYQGQIKHNEGKERKNLRIKDVDGDGLDDLIWLDPKSGQMVYWKNSGPSSNPIPAVAPNSAFAWVYKGIGDVGGQTRGSAIEIANINGLGRGDYITINPQENYAWVLYNICPNGGLAPVTPNLPTGAPPAPAYPISSSGGSTGGGPSVVCTSGTGSGAYSDLCAFTCMYGFCPKESCTCTKTGSPLKLPAYTSIHTCPATNLDDSFLALCQFACQYGHCPSATCQVVDPNFSCKIIPYKGSYNVNPTSLNSQSSCQDLGSNGIIQASSWEAMTTTTQLQNYLNNYLGTDFLLDFTNPLGVGVSVASACGRLSGSTCTPPNCGELTYPYTPGTGWEYLVVVAIVNLHNVLAAIYAAVEQASDDFRGQSTNLIETFYPSQPSSDNFLWIEILTGIATGLAAAAAATESPLVGALGAVFVGGIQEAVNYLSVQGELTTETGTLNADSVFWSNSTTTGLGNHWLRLMSNPGGELPNTFMGGDWVQLNLIPVLNVDSSKPQVTQDTLNNWYLNVLTASTIDWAWSLSNVYIYCYKMSQSDFNNIANRKLVADEMQYYSSANGLGCFIQSIDPYSDPDITTNLYPPGYKNLSKYPFNTSSIIDGSLSSFNQNGFNYTASTDDSIADVLGMSPEELNDQGLLWVMPGTFNLPICIPPSYTLTQFIEGIRHDNDDNSNAGWCGCQNVEDMNHVTFTDVVPIITSFPCSCDPTNCDTGFGGPG